MNEVSGVPGRTSGVRAGGLALEVLHQVDLWGTQLGWVADSLSRGLQDSCACRPTSRASGVIRRAPAHRRAQVHGQEEMRVGLGSTERRGGSTLGPLDGVPQRAHACAPTIVGSGRNALSGHVTVATWRAL